MKPSPANGSSQWAEIPGLAEAIDEENRDRDCAFLLPSDTIVGLPVRLITLGQYFTLELCRHPLIVGGGCGPEHLATFLWYLSPQYSSTDAAAREAFLEAVAAMPFEPLLAECQSYLANALEDAPGGSGNADGPSYWSPMAALVDVFATEYGWTIDEVLNCPLRRAWQLLRIIRRRNDPKALFFNPRSDAVKTNWLREINSRNRN